jgi:hypothetical protein
MLDLGLMHKMKTRPPPPNELVAAFRQFFAYKSKAREPLTQYQAHFAKLTFQHLQKAVLAAEEGLREDDFMSALDVVRLIPKDKTETHNELAKLLYAEIQKSNSPGKRRHGLLALLNVLSQTGHAVEAREMLIAEHETNSDSEPSTKITVEAKKYEKMWRVVLEGFAKEDNAAEFLKTLHLALSFGQEFNPFLQMNVVGYFASKDDLEAVKSWYSKPTTNLGNPGRPRSQTLGSILRLCIRTKELEWGREVFRVILSGKPNKQTWDIILQWAAGFMGKGVEDVDRMMDVMIKRNSEDESIRPDIDTINGLVELAISFKDPYLAERYISLGMRRGIQPNASTFILQMNYRTDANDLAGAQAAYEALQAEEVLDDIDLPAINKYIRALCTAKILNYDRIAIITSDLEERNKRLEADTTVALSIMYLHREEMDNLEDLLQSQSYYYSLDERQRIRDSFISFILDRSNSNKRAWDAYQMMRAIFDETSVELRTQLMNEFFARGRCDMACYVFGHMRQHDLQDRRPVLETYVQCFEGIARFGDRESLDMVHNMMKMDSAIEPNTKLYNALMLAYIGCEDSSCALDFWDDITNSNEGPSYRSLEIVFRACARKPWGDIRAREIWNKMRRMEIEVTLEVFAAYVGALAGQVKYEEARDLVESMETDLGLKPNVLTYVFISYLHLSSLDLPRHFTSHLQLPFAH